MPRKNANTTTAEQPVSAEPMTVAAPQAPASPASPAAPEAPTTGDRSRAPEAGKFSDIPDPRALMTAPLGTAKNGPKIELLRSHRFNQMQLQSGEPLQEKHQQMLSDAGWKDRTENEGIWTKQLPKEGEKWREAADAEKLFKQIANDMRAEKGLGSVLSV
jgi:hypothetical protein